MGCEHDWQPHPTANARYRCTKCMAIGCKSRAREARSRPNDDARGIRPYACAKCSEPATAHDSVSFGTRFEWRCPMHRSETT